MQTPNPLCPPKEECQQRQETGLRMWLTESLKEYPDARTHQEQEWEKTEEEAKQLRSDLGRLAGLGVAWSLLRLFSWRMSENMLISLLQATDFPKTAVFRGV
jgi:hypothetical protein